MGANTKPQLTSSMLRMYSTCGVQFQFRYGARFGCPPPGIEREIVAKPGVAMTVGTAVHASVAANLKSKIATGSLLPTDAVAAFARDTLTAAVDGSEIEFTDDEAVDIKATVGEAIDDSVRLAQLHHVELAPAIEPVGIEEPFVIALPNYPYDLAGQKDIREANRIRDTKTTGITPSDTGALTMQGATYAISEKVLRGVYPDFQQDFLVRLKKAKVVSHVVKGITEPMVSFQLARIKHAIETIATTGEGKYLHAANPDAIMTACCRRMCGYTAMCPFYSGK